MEPRIVLRSSLHGYIPKHFVGSRFRNRVVRRFGARSESAVAPAHSGDAARGHHNNDGVDRESSPLCNLNFGSRVL